MDRIVGVLVAIAVATILTRSVRNRNSDRAYSLQHGCQDPKVLSSRWPLGLDLILKAFKAAREQTVLHLFVEICQVYGPTFEQNLLGARGINTTDPRNLEAILSTQFKDFDLGDRPQTFFPLLGNGIFTQTSSSWKHSRDLLRPQFVKTQSRNFDEIQLQVENLIACIPSGRPVDLQPLFFRFTLDTTTFLLFGKSINSLTHEGSRHTSSDFAEAFRISQDYLARRGRLGGYYWLIGGKGFRHSCTTVHKFIDDVVKCSLKSTITVPDQPNKTLEGGSVLERLIQETRDPGVLRDQLLNVLLAGRDTTACCLSWTFRLLARHQPVLAKLREEIAESVGIGSSAREPSRQDIKRMVYLSLVLKEVLRLYPSVPVNSRSAIRKTTLPRGGGADGEAPLLVRSGEAVGYCVYAMHRRKDLYGDDADVFRPERWMSSDLKTIGYGYLPFNGGPRICLGQEFALLEVSFAVVRLLQVLPFIHPSELPGGGTSPTSLESSSAQLERQELTLVLASADGCWVTMHKEAIHASI